MVRTDVAAADKMYRQYRGARLAHCGIPRAKPGSFLIYGGPGAPKNSAPVGALRDLQQASVSNGSKAERLRMSKCCPLYPQKRTNCTHPPMSALCQKRT